MKKYFVILVSLFLLSALSFSQQVGLAPAVSSAQSLIQRVLPQHASMFVCETIPQDGGKDVFEIEGRNGKIVLRGNNGVSLAMAFNWYLRYHLLLSYSWQAEGPLEYDGHFPMPKEKKRSVCEAKERFFLNYCTYGYTFPYTNYEGWQRFMDWMAMNGVNRPLIHGGQEAVWLNVWKSYGLTEEQVCSYFTAPAHLAWHRMVNIDKWGGPLPMKYIRGQEDIQRRLIICARELGMKPILTGFAGHVPEVLKTVFPEAKITAIETWGGFKGYNTWFLDPMDPLFNDIQKRFLDEQRKMYGTDHLYAADPFNEIKPPSWEPDYIKSVTQTIGKGMEAADPKAVWYQMAWTFDFMPKWQEKDSSGKTPLDGILTALPPDKMILLEYMGEERELYRKTNNFNNMPFIWNYLANFGGCTYQLAPLGIISERIAEAMKKPNCIGVGSTLEGIATYPVGFEYTLEAPWFNESLPDLSQWCENYAKRRAGCNDPAVIKGWSILVNDVFNKYRFHYRDRSSILSKRPVFDQKQVSNLPDTALAEAPRRRNKEMLDSMVKAAYAMLEASPKAQSSDSYQYDLVNQVRQILAYEADNLGPSILQAFKSRDKKEFEQRSTRMLELMKDLDQLVGTRHEFLLGPWIDKARSWGDTSEEKDYYEKNSRQIITTWGAPGAGLTDYACREWNGLIADYYLPRWKEFVRRLALSMEGGLAFDVGDFRKWSIKHEGQWAATTGNGYILRPEGDSVQISRRILEKYFPVAK